jgi:hypothetical protein
MTYSKEAMQIILDVSDRFCMALAINIEYCNEIDSWLHLEYACEEC